MDHALAVARARPAISPWTAAAGLLGLAAAGVLLWQAGVADVLSLLARAWVGVLALVALHAVQLWLTAAAWHAVLPAGPVRPSRVALALLRLVREGINTLLPFAQIGGVVVAIRLLRRRGTSQAVAVGATVVDLNVEMLTQIVFTLLGVVLLVRGLGALPLALPLLGGLAMLCAMVAALTAAQWLGLARLSTRAAARLGFADGTAALRDTIRAIYADRAGLAWGAAGHLLAWALGALEVCLALHFLGHDVSPGQGWVIESLGQTVRAASFIVPAALGVQEGGYVVICGLFGIGPDLALALSLMKRLRELALGAPSLALWAWLERRGG